MVAARLAVQVHKPSPSGDVAYCVPNSGESCGTPEGNSRVI